MGSHAYVANNNALYTLGASFVWSNSATANAAYLKDLRMDKRMNIGATVASGINVIIDLGAAVPLTGFAVLNSNCAVQKTDATLKVEASSSSSFASDVNVAKAASTLYSTTSPRNKDHVLQFPGTYTKRYWRLTWTWTSNVIDFSIGEIFAFAASTTLNRRSIYGSGERQEIRTALQEMDYGETRGLFLAGPIRTINLDWEDMTETERSQIQTMWQTSLGGARPLLWIPSYESTATAAAVAEQECVYGRLMSPEFGWSERDYSLFTPDSIAIRSLGREAGA